MLKAVASNTLAQLVAKFFGAGLTLLTTYYTIRLAGLELYGDLTKVVVLVALGFTSIDFGLNADALRRSRNKEELQTRLGSVLITRLFLAGVAIILLNLLIFTLPGGYSHEVKSIFWFGSLAIFFQGIFTSGNVYFQFNLEYWRSTLSTVAGAFTTTVLTLYSLWHSPTLLSLVAATTIGYFISATTTLLLLPKIPKPRVHFRDIYLTLKSSAILGAILIASVLSSKLDTILLGVYRPSSEVGEYGFAYRIFDVILVLPVFVMNSLYPLMLRNKKNLLNTTLFSLGTLGTIAGSATYILAPLILLIKPGLTISLESLRLLSLSLPLFYLTAPLMWHLIAKNRERQVLITFLLSTILNLSLNLALIPYYGASAAAIVTGLTELFIFLSLLYYSLRVKSVL
ncbi:hypothetical protein DCC61_00220 [Candidatus Microgenomates bacterium]|nr:hypothetical protein [Candidatus Microgenomates bacterium CPR3]RIK52199.1 MAG: hypothetical protein DCC61_00220 [Candidatus Microgenomates bacterium]